MGSDSAGADQDENITCSECGAKVKSGAFCRQCGQPLAPFADDDQTDAGIEDTNAYDVTVVDELKPLPHSDSSTVVSDTSERTSSGEPEPVTDRTGTRGRNRGIAAVVIAGVGVLIGVGATVAIMSADDGNDGTASNVVASSEPSQEPSSRAGETSEAAPTTVEAVTSTEAPATTELAAILPIGLEEALLNAEPFRYSFPDGTIPVKLPRTIEGYSRYDGPDNANLSGAVRSATLRIFDDSEALVAPPEFSTQMNACNDTFWVARWVSKNPDVRIVATNDLDPMLGANGYVEEEPWLLPPEAPTGIMGATICTAPGFQFSSTANGNQANLADVVVEWTYFDRDAFADAGSAAVPSSGSCSTYTYDISLPIGLCAEGPAVVTLQEALGLKADGYFGSGTEQAVRDFQRNAGIAVTGVVDRIDWSYIGPADYGVVGPLD